MEKIITLSFLFIWVLPSSAQKELSVSFDKHVIVVLEGMEIVKPLDNTCGEYEVDGVYDNIIKVDSLDNKHIRYQANDSHFDDCNFTIFTNRGILILETKYVDSLSRSQLIQVFSPEDLAYKYDEKQSEAVTSQVISDTPEEAFGIQYVFDQLTGPDFTKKETMGLVDFALTNIIYHDDHLYFVLVIYNNSSIDYHLGAVYFKHIIKEGKRKSAQENETIRDPVESIVPEGDLVPAGDFKALCYKLEKFTLTKNNELRIEIVEDNGRRQQTITVKNAFFHSNTSTLF